ncbi:MAG: hypothetical protein L6Q38_14555, partial [Nitrospira sp.]|nr:hypothetical protein [Nitrospira sp.]
LGVLTGDPQAGWVLRLGEFEEIVKRYPTLGSNPFPSIAIAPPPPHPIPPAALAARAALRWIRPFLVSSAVVFTIVLLACLPSAGATWIAGVVVLAACVWPVKATVFEAERKRRIWHLATIRERVSFLYKQWDSDHREQYNREVIELGRSLDKYRDLDRRRGTILTDLERERRDQQFHDYLDGFPIGPAKIKNIGTGRKQVLETYGIETAADVNRARLANVPGFGPGLTKDLMDWRKSLSATFRYDGSKPVERSVAMRALQPLQQERQMLEAAILRSQAVLGNLHQQMTERRSTVRREVEEALRTMAQAQADVDIMAKAG